MANRKNFERLTRQIRYRNQIEAAICDGIRNMVKFPKIYDQAVSVIVAIQDAGFKIVRDPHKKDGFMRVVGDPPAPCLCGEYGEHTSCVVVDDNE